VAQIWSAVLVAEATGPGKRCCTTQNIGPAARKRWKSKEAAMRDQQVLARWSRASRADVRTRDFDAKTGTVHSPRGGAGATKPNA
jgi:hypothetical protein